MSAQPIPNAYTPDLPAPVSGDLFAALRAVFDAGFPELTPSIYPQHAELLRAGSPRLTDSQRAAALAALATVPGLSLRRLGTDPTRTLTILGGALPLYAGHTSTEAPSEAEEADYGLPETLAVLARALAHLGLPSAAHEQTLSTIAQAIAADKAAVLAALRLVPHVPALRGALYAERPPLLASLAVAGVVLSLILATRRQDSAAV